MELLSCELTCGKEVDQLRAHSSNLQHLGKTILFDVNRSLVINLVAGVVYSSQCELSHRGQ